MRSLTLLSVVLIACSSRSVGPAAAPAPTAEAPAGTRSAEPASGEAAAAVERLSVDTPKATVAGNTFIAAAEWALSVRGAGTILEAPEGGSFVAIYELREAKDADDAVEQAWVAFRGGAPFPLVTRVAGADGDGWSKVQGYSYDVPPNLKRAVGANARFANGVWTVVLFDAARAVAEKRSSQVGLMLGKLLPKGTVRESFAGRSARQLEGAGVAALLDFVSRAEEVTRVPGVAFGVVQDGKVIYAGGVGVRERGKLAQVDGDTKFMIASNTKALATLMLAKLVDSGKVAWDTKAKQLLPSFALGDADTTSQVQVKHLICACTGLPRQDFEWLFQWAGATPERVMQTLAGMQPTSKFGELFQYSNPLAAAAGYIGGHVAYRELELGAAFDRAMRTTVFEPLHMSATTFDFAKGQAGNAAVPHAPDVDGNPALAVAKVNLSVVPVRPAGGAWSSVRDMLKYVQMELAEGVVESKAYIGKDALLARRSPQVAIGSDATYGMGLMVDKTWGVTVVHHGGDLIGFHSDMIWLPEHGVGAVILTNGDPGWLIRSHFQRKLLEVLFDGKPEADAQLAASAKAFLDWLAAERKLLTVPASAQLRSTLAARYASGPLGEIAVRHEDGATVFDFGEYASEVASRTNPDGTVSFITTVPGMIGLEFVVGERDGRRTLTTRDGQHEYVFVEAG